MSSEDEGARFSPRRTNSKTACCVKGCDSRAWLDATIRFHSFPQPGADFVNFTDEFGVSRKICRREAWERILTLDRRPITATTRVCSLHFRQSDYPIPGLFLDTSRKYLKRDAIPSCNLGEFGHEASEECSTTGQRVRTEGSEAPGPWRAVTCEAAESTGLFDDAGAAVRRDHCYVTPGLDVDLEIKEEPVELAEVKLEPTDGTFSDTTQSAVPETTQHEEPAIKLESVDLPEIFLSPEYRELWGPYEERGSIVHNPGHANDERFGGKLTDVLRSDKALSIVTGIPNHRVFNEIVERIRAASPRFAKAPGLRLTLEDRIIMTFAKLKEDLNYGLLAVFFKCSSGHVCRRIVLRTLRVLGDCLSSTIRWPRTESRSPTDDSRQFGNIRCVVNRIELDIARSKNASVRLATRSRYKRRHTVKFVTAVTPAGFVCLVSPAWDGGISHELAFERSNVFASLQRNDAIVILKEFPVDDLCRRNNARLVRSLASTSNENLKGLETWRTSLNVNRKIRGFRIFRRKLSASLYRRADKMVTAICALENLRKSTMAETKAS